MEAVSRRAKRARVIHRNGVSDGQMCRQRVRQGLTAEEAETGRGGDRESD